MADLLGIGTIASGLYNGTVNLGLGIGNIVSEQYTNEQNREMQLKINRENAALTRELNEKNRQYELEDQAYLAQREDTALQRKAAELEALGINPIMAGLAGGQGAQSQMVGARNTSNMIAAEAPQATNAFAAGAEFLKNTNPFTEILANKRLLSEIKKNEADTNDTKTGTEGKRLDNISKMIELDYAQDRAEQELKEKINQNQSLEQAIKTATRQYEYMMNAEERAKANHIIEQQLKEQEKKIREYEQKINQAKDEREQAELEQEIKEFKVNTGIKIIDSIGNFVVKGAEYGLELYDRHIRRRDRNNRRYNNRRNP